MNASVAARLMLTIFGPEGDMDVRALIRDEGNERYLRFFLLSSQMTFYFLWWGWRRRRG